jgi:hypothetical protein
MTLTLQARHVAAAVIGVVVLAAGSGALAGGAFTDVPPSHPFSQQIGNIVGAGITTGYEDGTYRPGAPVTRGAMAAFMNRGFGRVGYDEGTVTTDDNNTVVTVAQTAVTAGATQGGGGFVQVTAAMTASTGDATQCPCGVFLSLNDGTTTKGTVTGVISNDDVVIASGLTTLSTTAVFAIPADATRTYRIRASYLNIDVEDVAFEGHISATYVPFGPSGGNTL